MEKKISKITEIEENAAKLGISVEIKDGRFRFEANRAGDIIKLWASVGADVTRDGDGCWVVSENGNYRACILTSPEIPNYAYSYTTIA